jgi:hypothetical protein
MGFKDTPYSDKKNGYRWYSGYQLQMQRIQSIEFVHAQPYERTTPYEELYTIRSNYHICKKKVEAREQAEELQSSSETFLPPKT